MSDQVHPAGLWPVPGDGVLARQGSLILLSTLDSGQLVDDLLDLLAEVAGAAANGSRFAEAVADAIEKHTDDADPLAGPAVLAFGAAGPGMVVTVSGTAWADVTTAHGTRRIEGLPGMLLRCTLRSPVSSVRAGLGPGDDGDATTDRFSRLDGGTIRAGGLAYYPAPAEAGAGKAAARGGAPGAAAAGKAAPGRAPSGPAPEPAPVDDGPDTMLWSVSAELAAEQADALTELPAVLPPPVPAPAQPPPVQPPPVQPPPASQRSAQPQAPPPQTPPQAPPPHQPLLPAQPFEAVLLIDGGPEQGGIDVPVRPPLSAVPELISAENVLSQGPVIEGVYCKNGHFDDPEALFCAVCGISMNQQTLIPRPGPRPPLGVLVLDDGSVFQLDCDYVIGREPTLDGSVAAGAARPLRVTDDSGVVSRVHARVQLEGWRVLVTDLDSANGTRVQLPRQLSDQVLVAQVPFALVPGSQVDLGGRGFRYESHRGR